ncbi:MAG TPA: hypothetical protein ENK19_04175, partial [Acidobacteria bacterium]|nr:hypothetical protein [Acidobacteriota bacterium]
MIRRWMTVLMSMTMVVALAGLTGCHKKAEKTEEVKTPAAAEQPQGQEEAQETQETQETETGPEPSPRPAGPVVYPNGEEPVLANGARIVRQERDPGHWEVEYTVNVPPQQMVDFYRQEAGRRGWTE